MATINMGDARTSGTTVTEDEEVVEEAKEAVEEKSTEEKETPSESSPEEKPDAEESSDSDKTETTNVDDSESVTEKELQGLAAQKAELSRDIQELRAERRKVREEKQDIMVDTKVSKNDLADVAESDIAVMDKWAASRGYVRKEELQGMTYKEKLDSFKEQWIEKHPEYNTSSKENDDRWDKLNQEVSAFYKSPTNPQDIVKILDRAHTAISKGTLPTKSSAQASASQEKVRVTSKTSQSGVSAKPQTVKRTINRAAFGDGWSEEDLKELET